MVSGQERKEGMVEGYTSFQGGSGVLQVLPERMGKCMGVVGSG